MATTAVSKQTKMGSASSSLLKTNIQRSLFPLYRTFTNSLRERGQADEIFFETLEAAVATLPSRRDDAKFQALRRGLQQKRALLNERGGCVSAEEAAQILDVSKQRVFARFNDAKNILGIRMPKQNSVFFPLWQFDEEQPQVLPGVEAVLQIFKEQPAIDGLAALTFFLSRRDSLGGRAPIDLIKAGNSEQAVNLAKSYGT